LNAERREGSKDRKVITERKEGALKLRGDETDFVIEIQQTI
jgi:hypothetical protein